ncbi:putative bzip transcription factor [Rosellinia necatrix]|uniref:Putative bzip transcription factor n=1 Tax=Rosellinia necatrix TaxID=77044 RepID=A0A1W2TEX1_ROSNE|nr:putative bzip transcription factor [Rosellinia necatrix]
MIGGAKRLLKSEPSGLEIYESFPNHDQFQQTFDQYPTFNHHNQAFPGPPGPPTPPNIPLNGQNHTDTNRQTGSNSEEDDLSPAQSRRKAQNRAAQRAFRERKERHVKDLEAKLASLEAAQSLTATENEKLRREMQKMSTENEILRATSTVHAQHNGSISPVTDITTGPMQYNPTEFYSDLLQNHTNKTPSHRIVESGGERLLAAGATWDYIINHDLFKKGLVDVADVSERLKCQAKCDGQGPVFEERAVLKAIMDSVASGSDELL